ncbi:ABC transporter permease subunit [bacterium]|nr:ABC transporter permease subunit [bacterium]
MSSEPAILVQPTAATSAGDRVLQLADRLTDRLNPILVKEMRQALKSRQFVVTFMLLLMVGWLVSAGTAIFASHAMEFGSAGHGLFLTYFAILAFAVFVIVPFGAHRSMLAERDQNTYELLSISTLTPRQIVNGKLLSAMVQSFVYYSAVTPFIAFASLLQGFDLPLSLFLLVVAFLWSICVSMFTLMLSTLAQKKQVQAANSLGMFFLLMFQLYLTAGLLIQSSMTGVPFDDPEFWWSVGITIAGAGSYTLLAQQIAVSRLTFESGNRSSGIRLICAAQFWLYCGALLAYWLWSGRAGISSDDIRTSAWIAAVHWGICGLFASTETDWLSRRLRRKLPRNGLLRLIVAPWLPGGARGLLWMLLHVAVVLTLALLVDWDDQWVAPYLLGLFSYAIIWVGLGAAMTRWLRAIVPTFRPAHGRVLTVLLGLGFLVAPLIARAFSDHAATSRFQWLDLMNPFMTLPRLTSDSFLARADSSLETKIVIALSVAAGVVVLLNLRAIFNGVWEIVRQRPDASLDQIANAR